MPKYLCIRRSQPVQPGSGEKPSPAQMEEMYAKFNAWKANSALSGERRRRAKSRLNGLARANPCLPSSVPEPNQRLNRRGVVGAVKHDPGRPVQDFQSGRPDHAGQSGSYVLTTYGQSKIS